MCRILTIVGAGIRAPVVASDFPSTAGGVGDELSNRPLNKVLGVFRWLCRNFHLHTGDPNL